MSPLPSGAFDVASTNLEIAQDFVGMGDQQMHEYLLGLPGETGQLRFLDEILKHPETVWVNKVEVPADTPIYGPAQGRTLSVVSYVVYPTTRVDESRRYKFPYHNSMYGEFLHMLKPGDVPVFANSNQQYPLIILSHGSGAHGLYDVAHAQWLASFGFIVAVPTYGDDRTRKAGSANEHAGFLRPLLTKALLDSLLDSPIFGPHIDKDNIGITGHSYGGFTALTMAGAPYQDNRQTVFDERVKAIVLAAPWVGGNYNDNDVFAFGEKNNALGRVTVPVLCAFGTADQVTEASFILPAMKQLSGPTYVVELVNQPHVFEQGSWQDRDNWERLFFSAYLQGDSSSLEQLVKLESMPGGNKDRQLFEYQRTD